MEAVFKPLMDDLACELCRQVLKEKVKDVVAKWASVKVSGYKHFDLYVHFLTGRVCHQRCGYTLLESYAPLYKWDEWRSRLPTLHSRLSFIVLWLIGCAFLCYSGRFNFDCFFWLATRRTVIFSVSKPYTISGWVSPTR